MSFMKGRKSNFDFTPVVRERSGQLIIRTGAGVLLLAAVALLFGSRETALALFRGMVIGCLDLAIMFAGIKRSLRFVNEPERGVRLMKRYRYYRLAAAGSILCLMLKMKFPVFYAMAGFLLIHIFYIFNLTFVAYQLKQEGNVKKGV